MYRLAFNQADVETEHIAHITVIHWLCEDIKEAYAIYIYAAKYVYEKCMNVPVDQTYPIVKEGDQNRW